MTWLVVVATAVTTVTSVVVGLATVALVARLLRHRPSSRTSARDRLLRRNPALAARATLPWSVRARRVHIDRWTTLVVGVALLLTTLRPTTIVGGTGDRS